jgi:hypothetical protein
MLLPMWFPTIVVGAWLFEALYASGRNSQRPGVVRVTRVLAVGAVALLGWSIAWSIHRVAAGADVAYREASPSSEDVRRALEVLPPHARVLSNDPWRIYIAARRQPVFLAPMKIRPSFSHRPVHVREVTQASCSRSLYLLWFDSSPTTFHRSVRALEGRTQLVLTNERRVDGGTLYAIQPAAGAAPCEPNPSRASS